MGENRGRIRGRGGCGWILGNDVIVGADLPIALQINGPEKPIAQKIDYPIAMTLFLLTDQLSPPVI